MDLSSIDWQSWLVAGGLLLAAAVAGLVVHFVLFALLRRLARRTEWELDEPLVLRVRRPARLLFPLFGAQMALPEVRRLAGENGDLLGHAFSLVLIAGMAWLSIAVLGAIEDHIEKTHRIDVADNLEARRLRTQTTVLKRVLVTLVVVVAVGAALMTFPRVRQIGTSLLASAGIVGLALGIAARPVLENLIAGLQLAVTQPVRLDDVVVVEGEWGRIEEITATYVVVRIWDERRLVVPFGKFISGSFENWTRTTADILGTVFVYADYGVPVEAVRKEVRRIVEDSDDWDGRVCGVQVTGATDRTMELRALVSASDASKAWNLRCRVREELIAFLQREYPDALPRTRVNVAQASEPVREDELVR